MKLKIKRLSSVVSEDVLEKISNLWLAMINELNIENSKPDVNGFKNYINKMIPQDYYFMYIIENDKEIIGFMDAQIIYDFVYSDFIGYGNHFYIIPSYRNIASPKLYRHILHCVKLYNLKKMALCTWESKLTFWNKHGFNTERYILTKNFQRGNKWLTQSQHH